ncbi:ankyrin repeat-containing domain protein [Echria macrotheca]|uniref:Ankyrin repeat-containing domain protein n=1 Tax=Echria macrotheca TaxID=438768 RepID=A0AAJ0BLA9_9PEZI|nr:ankyrin repeat-containing domain protein [Echria macrotheca]
MSITANGKRLPVTPNLYMALRYLRRSDQARVLWVDAVCINQDDVTERGHQVQQMGGIYRHAERVLVWLGTATYEINILMDTLIELQRKSTEYATSAWKTTDYRWQELWDSVLVTMGSKGLAHIETQQKAGLEALFQSPWFRRVWILQEVANARAVLICCGKKSVPARFLVLAPVLLGVITNHHCQAVLDIMPGPSRMDSWWARNRELYHLLIRFHQSEASDQRDKIYALLGISSDSGNVSVDDSKGIRPDYSKSVPDLIRDVIRFLFQTPAGADPYGILVVRGDAPETVPDLLRQLYEGTLSEAIFCGVAKSATKETLSQLLRWGDVRPCEPTIRALAGNKTCGSGMLEDLITSYIPIDTNYAEADIIRRLFARFAESGSATNAASELYDAIADGDAYRISQLLQMGIDINVSDKLLGTPLEYAIEHAHDICAVCYRTESVPFEPRTAAESIRLAKSARKNYMQLLRQLLDHQADITTHGWRPLEMALRNGDKDVAQLLLSSIKHNARTSPPESRRKQLIFQLAFSRNFESVVQSLLEMWHLDDRKLLDLQLREAVSLGQADITRILLNQREGGRLSQDNWLDAIEHAIRTGDDAAAELLLNAKPGAATESEDTRPLLPLAVKCGSMHLTLLLLQRGASPNRRNSYGLKPIHVAASRGRADLVTLLIDHGSDPEDKVPSTLRTPLSYAAESGSLPLIRLLLDNPSVKADGRDIFERSYLHYAATAPDHDESAVTALLDHIDADVADWYYSTPLSVAVRWNRLRSVRKLLATGKVDVNAKDCFGRTPLYWAMSLAGGRETVRSRLSLPLSILSPAVPGLDTPTDLIRMLFDYAKEQGATIDEGAELPLAKMSTVAAKGDPYCMCSICMLPIWKRETYYVCDEWQCSSRLILWMCSNCYLVGGRCIDGDDHNIIAKTADG